MKTDARVLIYDIECSDLDPDRGRIFAFAYKWLGEKRAKTISLLDFNDPCSACGLMKQGERPLLLAIREIMRPATTSITFNGKNFDSKYLNSKFMRERIPALGPLQDIDLYQVARVKMRLSRKSLANISKYLRLKHQKTFLDFDIWQRASEGESAALRYIARHGSADVLVTEELYLDHLRPYVTNHPRLIDDRDPCGKCGGKLRRDKIFRLKGGDRVQYVCGTCGGYETRSN